MPGGETPTASHNDRTTFTQETNKTKKTQHKTNGTKNESDQQHKAQKQNRKVLCFFLFFFLLCKFFRALRNKCRARSRKKKVGPRPASYRP